MSLRVNKQANEVLAKSLQTSCEFGKKKAYALITDFLFWNFLFFLSSPLVCSDAFNVTSIKGMNSD